MSHTSTASWPRFLSRGAVERGKLESVLATITVQVKAKGSAQVTAYATDLCKALCCLNSVLRRVSRKSVKNRLRLWTCYDFVKTGITPEWVPLPTQSQLGERVQLSFRQAAVSPLNPAKLIEDW